MNKKQKILNLSILLVLIISLIGGVVYSKYLTEINGTGIGELASWKPEGSFTDENGNIVDNWVIPVTSTGYNENIVVKDKIAPGVTNQFEIEIDGSDMELGFKTKVEFTTISKPQNMHFVWNSYEFATLEELGEAIGESTANVGRKSSYKDYVIQCVWPYTIGTTPEEKLAYNQRDMEDLINNNYLKFNVKVTIDQIEPTTT